MDLITKSAGLNIVAETIFINLNHKDLLKCQEVSQNWKALLNNPTFWLRICIRSGKLSQQHQKEWKNIIQFFRNSNPSKDIGEYNYQNAQHKLFQLSSRSAKCIYFCCYYFHFYHFCNIVFKLPRVKVPGRRAFEHTDVHIWACRRCALDDVL